MALSSHTMMTMKFSRRTVATVVAAVLVAGGLVRLGRDKHPVAVSLPDAVEALPAGASLPLPRALFPALAP